MSSPSAPSAPLSPVDLPPPLLPPGAAVTPWDPAAVQWIKDGEHLRMLSIFHYIAGGLAVLFSSVFIFYIVFGTVILTNPHWLESSSSRSRTFASPAPAASPDETDAPPSDSTPTASRRRTAHGDAPPAFFGYMIIGVGTVAVLLGWTVGGLLIYSGRCLARRTRRVFSMVVAGVSCLQVPVGTILGVFTLVVLQRPTVQALYAAGEQK